LRLFRSRSRLAALAAAVVLLVLGTVGMEVFASHTDDGCEVEQHCLLCRVSVARVAVGASGSPVTFALLAADVVSPPAVEASRSADRTAGPSRAPPLS
jgi:hypothetical protein